MKAFISKRGRRAAKAIVATSVIGAAGILVSFRASALGPNFRPDYTLRGKTLDGWHTIGHAQWRMENGELIGKPTDPAGGWLVLDKSFQDVAFYADMFCTGECNSGVLLRITKTADGTKGVFFSAKPGEFGSYALSLDSAGRIVHRQKLPEVVGNEAKGSTKYTPAMIAALMRPGGPMGVLPLPPGVHLPELNRASDQYVPNAWNSVEVLLHDNALQPALNGGALHITGDPLSGSVKDDMGASGPLAIYVGGTSEVHLKNVSYKDLLLRPEAKEYIANNYHIQRLDPFYYSWSAAVADVNRDGVPDIIAGPYVYMGPDYTEVREIYKPAPLNPGADYPMASMVNLAYDFTGDGWPDVLVISGISGMGTGTLYVNPRGESRHWDKYVVLKALGNEDTLMKDIDGDGKPEIIHAGNNSLQYSKPDPANPTGPWITKTISEPGPWGSNVGHGLGVGDINGDGRMDYVNAYGWWEQPAPGSGQKLWTYHPQAFGRWGHTNGAPGATEIGVYDVNGDGLNDVVTGLEGHGFGLAWYEQKRDSAGNRSFVRHIIMDNFLTKNAGDVTFTEPHAAAFADMDGDGIPDMITGKRSMSHSFGYTDPDPFGPAVLYVYKTVRNPNAPGGAEFVPELIYNRSGVGSHFTVVDLNGDGTPDIITSGAYGTFVFFNHEQQGRRKSTSASR